MIMKLRYQGPSAAAVPSSVVHLRSLLSKASMAFDWLIDFVDG